jgi:VanZ family protein
MPARPRTARRLFVSAWVPVLAYVVVIALLSSYPQPQVASIFTYEDKILHLGEYGVLGVLLARAMASTAPGEVGLATYAGAVAWGALVGVADEIYQASTPGRSSSLADLATDVCALCLAALLVRFVRARRARIAGA